MTDLNTHQVRWQGKLWCFILTSYYLKSLIGHTELCPAVFFPSALLLLLGLICAIRERFISFPALEGLAS